ncbi:MAG: hypothetical protein KIT69_20675, partial [Propionibacteriaceae bacterium]|nr:hypothetical protein [Propionibacteriaceae bacterium]
PVILDPDGYEGWLTGDAEAAAGLLKTHDPDGMAFFAVGRAVNHVANDDESLLSPAGPEPGPGTQGLLL